VLQCVAVCCSVLRCVAVCCSVLQCAAVCCGVLQCVAVCCSVLQCVAVCCSVLWCVAVCCSVLQCVAVCFRVLQCVAVRYNVLQCVAVCCSVLQRVAVCCSVSQRQVQMMHIYRHSHINSYTIITRKSELSRTQKWVITKCMSYHELIHNNHAQKLHNFVSHNLTQLSNTSTIFVSTNFFLKCILHAYTISCVTHAYIHTCTREHTRKHKYTMHTYRHIQAQP